MAVTISHSETKSAIFSYSPNGEPQNLMMCTTEGDIVISFQISQTVGVNVLFYTILCNRGGHFLCHLVWVPSRMRGLTGGEP